MGLDQAVREMELVGHDFYLYHDQETGQPSVVYRRRGWSYGVIHLDVDHAAHQLGREGVLTGDASRPSGNGAGQTRSTGGDR